MLNMLPYLITKKYYLAYLVKNTYIIFFYCSIISLFNKV